MHDLIIVGAGPAGLTAAIYAGRYRLNTLVLEKMNVGGQIILSSWIENFPGFPGGVAPQDLMQRFRKQTDELGIAIKMAEVTGITLLKDSGKGYTLKTGGKTYQARATIIASGAKAKQLGAKGEQALVGRGVSYCATCDGPLFKDKEVVVIGGGDRALEEALFLCAYARRVTLIHRRSSLRASKILQEKAGENKKISFLWDSTIEEIIGCGAVQGIKVKNVKTGLLQTISCQGVFIFVGIQPNTGFLKNILQTDEAGFIIVDQDMHTQQPGLFACGDCCRKPLYQVVTACGEAALAAYSAQRYLMSQGY